MVDSVEEDAPLVDIKETFQGNEKRLILIFKLLYTNENILMNIVFPVCSILQIDLPTWYTRDL